MYPIIYSYQGLMPAWPLMYVISHFPYVYDYKNIIYKPKDDYFQKQNIYLKQKKNCKKTKSNGYSDGITETLELIECYNPEVFDFLSKCGMPYKTARKIVRKMINSLI